MLTTSNGFFSSSQEIASEHDFRFSVQNKLEYMKQLPTLIPDLLGEELNILLNILDLFFNFNPFLQF